MKWNLYCCVIPEGRYDGYVTDLEHRGHEHGAAHEGEDHQARESLLSDAEELGLLPGGRALGLQLQAVDVGDGEHGGRHEPRQTHQRAHAQHHPHHEQVQVIATAFLKGGGGGTSRWSLIILMCRSCESVELGLYLKLVLLPVDDDSSDLLVHEDEDGAEQSWDHGYDCCPPGVGPQRVNEPASIIPGRLININKMIGICLTRVDVKWKVICWIKFLP